MAAMRPQFVCAIIRDPNSAGYEIAQFAFAGLRSDGRSGRDSTAPRLGDFTKMRSQLTVRKFGQVHSAHLEPTRCPAIAR
jgi:hypothetical protein